MKDMSVTLEVSHELMSLLKAVAPSNMLDMSVTLLGRVLGTEIKFDAPKNAQLKLVQLPDQLSTEVKYCAPSQEIPLPLPNVAPVVSEFVIVMVA